MKSKFVGEIYRETSESRRLDSCYQNVTAVKKRTVYLRLLVFDWFAHVMICAWGIDCMYFVWRRTPCWESAG